MYAFTSGGLAVRIGISHFCRAARPYEPTDTSAARAKSAKSKKIQDTKIWYRDPFCHQMSPYQALRARTLWTQLLVRFRVFFNFGKSENHINEVQKSRNVFSQRKEKAGRPKPRQRGLANRICFYQNPQIPESQIPNLKISQIPKMQIWKFANLDEKSIKTSRWSFWGKFRNWQIQNFQINSPLSTDRF